MQATVVISRGAGERNQKEIEDALAELCSAAGGLNVLLVPHLYHIPERSAIWPKLAGIGGPWVCITWLYPRPASWVLQSRGIGAEGLQVLCLKDYPSAQEAHAAILEAIHLHPDAAGSGPEEIAEMVAERWYPVLDAERCRNCQHCLQFCLFGVYALDDAGRVRVTHPDNCKPGCPACSRICPEGAIMFPLYERDEAIAGAPGRLMAPDAAARKMFYARTRRTCPICGSTADAPGTGDGGTCEECGRAVAKAEHPEAAEFIRDDLDTLLDDLDQLAQGNP